MEKFFTLILALATSVGTMFAGSGTCGENLTWTLSEDSTLTISGKGAMTNYGWDSNLQQSVYAPWYSIRDSIKSVVINSGVTSIGNDAFSECDSLASVSLPNTVTKIGKSAFYSCASLKTIVFPNSLTTIGRMAFMDSGLTSVTLPNSVTSVGSQAFDYCKNLTEPIYNDYLFARLPRKYEGEYTVKDGIKVICDVAFCDCSKLTGVKFPESLIEIGSCAFEGCGNLQSVTIPKNVETIGVIAFMTIVYDYMNREMKCNLTAINVDSDNQYYASVNGVLYDKNIKTLIQYPLGKKNYVFNLPNTVDSISGYACYGALFSELNLPNSLKIIDRMAFLGCNNLSKLTIPNSVEKIYPVAFEGCINLTELTIGSGIQYIGGGAFTLDSAKCKSVVCLAEKVPSTVCNDCSELPVEGSNADIISVQTVTHNEWGDSYKEIDQGNLKIFVPTASLSAYQNDDMWGRYHIIPISAEQTETTDVTITASENSVNIVWPSISGAASYELVIKDKSGKVVCTLIFDAQGQLTSIAFNAPGRRSPNQTQTAGFSFTVTGLENNTSYDLTITAKNGSGTTLDQKTTSFTTGTNAIDQITNDQSQTSNKSIRNGHLYILRDGKTYTVQGQEIK